MEVVMAAGGMVLGEGDGCDGDEVVRVEMTMVVDLWCGSGGGWPESGRKKVEWRRKSIRRRGVVEKDITPKDRKQSQKMTKPDTEWKSCKRQGQSKAKDQISQSQSQLNKSTVKTKAVIEEYYWMQSQPI
ncbi:hypothetical protein Tco_0091908 [Tanacetum coccineum]